MVSSDPNRARLPPALPGLDPKWSRLVPVVDADGVTHTWHVLDSQLSSAPPAAQGTILCVHGNPTWSYLWRRLVAAPPAGWRVVAVDQLGMGYSDRPDGPRRLGTRIDDLGRLTAELGVDGPVVTVAHDWGGPISLGWALAHRDRLAGIVLTNTAVHQPAGSPAPALIRLAGTPGLRQLICQNTPAFVRTTSALSRPALPKPIRAALAAPYDRPDRRRAIADFVADIPLDDRHQSAAALASVVAGLPGLADIPVLLLWGPRDPVFSDLYLRDLLKRFPQADVHRFEGASHLVTEDRPETAAAIARWIAAKALPSSDGTPSAAPSGEAPDPAPDPVPDPVPAEVAAAGRPLWAALDERRDDPAPAIVEPGGTVGKDGTVGTVGTVFTHGTGGTHGTDGTDGTDGRDGRDGTDATGVTGGTVTSFSALARRVDSAAAALHALGVRRGDRVALLITPGLELTVVVYACWRLGAVIVVADAGLGLRRLGRALRGSGGEWVVGSRRGLLAARALRVPGRRVSPSALVTSPLDTSGVFVGFPDQPTGADLCAVVFTSGATGPPKGVVYRHAQVQRQIALLRETYGLTDDDRLVAAFAPFALYGPALGIASAVPDMDVTAPATLTAAALADAIDSLHATVVFASPAALVNVLATAGDLDHRQRQALRGPRLLLSAGAPLPSALLRLVQDVLPAAEIHTPYGMTETLPVTDVTLAQIDQAQARHAQNGHVQNERAQGQPTAHGDGVCVGRPVHDVLIGISPLDPTGSAPGPPGDAVDVTGEVCVRAAHGKERYDRLWITDANATRDAGWHRTGDVGHVDGQGRLWIEGRLGDVARTATGPVTPVPVEQRILALPAVAGAAVVGVGPAGSQQLVAVLVEPQTGPAGLIQRIRRSVRRPDDALRLADLTHADAVRSAARVPLAAVLLTTALPVDIRHNSKINHPLLAERAELLLAGHRPHRFLKSRFLNSRFLNSRFLDSRFGTSPPHRRAAASPAHRPQGSSS